MKKMGRNFTLCCAGRVVRFSHGKNTSCHMVGRYNRGGRIIYSETGGFYFDRMHNDRPGRVRAHSGVRRRAHLQADQTEAASQTTVAMGIKWSWSIRAGLENSAIFAVSKIGASASDDGCLREISESTMGKEQERDQEAEGRRAYS